MTCESPYASAKYDYTISVITYVSVDKHNITNYEP